MSNSNNLWFNTQSELERKVSERDNARASERWDNFSSLYGVGDEYRDIVLPLLATGASQDEILQYISKLHVSEFDKKQEEEAFADKIRLMRASGINPDLSGVPDSGESAATPSFEPLPSSGGKGTLMERFGGAISNILRIGTFALQGYKVFSDVSLAAAAEIGEAVQQDLTSVLGNENGVVDSFDSALHGSLRGYTGKKLRKYSQMVASNLNSAGVVLSRLKTNAAIEREKGSLFEAKEKNTSEYRDFFSRGLKANAQANAISAELSLKEAQAKEAWLLEHPDYTAEQLDRELASSIADAAIKQSEASEASSRASAAASQARSAAAAAQVAEANVEPAKAEAKTRGLKAKLQGMEYEDTTRLLEIVYEFEKSLDGLSWIERKQYEGSHFEESQRYKYAKQLLKERKGKSSGKVNINTPVGGVGFDI